MNLRHKAQNEGKGGVDQSGEVDFFKAECALQYRRGRRDDFRAAIIAADFYDRVDGQRIDRVQVLSLDSESGHSHRSGLVAGQ